MASALENLHGVTMDGMNTNYFFQKALYHIVPEFNCIKSSHDESILAN